MLLEDSAVIVDRLGICLVERDSFVSKQKMSAVVLGCSKLLLGGFGTLCPSSGSYFLFLSLFALLLEFQEPKRRIS